MSLPTVSDVQAVDPVLTNMLVGYMQADSRFVADRVFPVIPVANDSGTYYIFTKKYWFLNNMAVRAPGGQYARGDFGVETTTFSTIQYALAHAIADEIRANSQVPMDLETAAVRWLSQQALLKKEIQWATDFMTTSVWTTQDNNSTTDWDDFTSGDPVNDIIGARRTVSNLTGLDPNTLVLGYIVHQALVNHPDILDRVKYTTSAIYGNVETALSAVFGIANYWVAKASYTNTNEAASFSASAIVDDDALLCYVSPSPGVFEASSGYTFAWPGGGGAGTILRNRDDLNDTDVIKMKMQWDQKVVAADTGAIWLDVV